MKNVRFLGIVLAIMLHVGFILFGGLLFGSHKEDQGTTQEVDLLTDDEAAAAQQEEKKEEKPKEADAKEVDEEELESEQEEAPDAAEIVRTLELSGAASAPALEAASLSAIEAALSGQGGGSGDFAESLSFASGGRIGGMGKATALEENLESAFSLAEIDQKPRVVFQAPPIYPSEMRGQKVEGVVSVLFIVDPSGKVTNPRLEKSTHAAFERPALEAVRKWKFEPAVRGGERVPCKMRVSIRFQPRS